MPLLFAAGSIVLFVLGGISGVATAAVPFDWQLTDTYFVVAYLHYTLAGFKPSRRRAAVPRQRGMEPAPAASGRSRGMGKRESAPGWWGMVLIVVSEASLLTNHAAAGLLFVLWLWPKEVRTVRPVVLRAGRAATVAAVVGLLTGCPFHAHSSGVGDGTAAAAGDSTKPPHSMGSGGGRTRGLIDGLFDHTPGEADRESSDRAGRTPRQGQAFIDMLRNAYGPGRQGYEEPMPTPRQSRAAPRLSRRSRKS